jgi:hypothetical protein
VAAWAVDEVTARTHFCNSAVKGTAGPECSNIKVLNGFLKAIKNVRCLKASVEVQISLGRK